MPKFLTYGDLPTQSSYNSLSLGSNVDTMLGSARNLILPLPTLPGAVVDLSGRELLRKGEGGNGTVRAGVEARGVARVEAVGAT